MIKRYKFIGKPDRLFPELKTGKIYNLDVKEMHEYSTFGIVFGKKFISVTGDITCPYSSWESFYKNWEAL